MPRTTKRRRSTKHRGNAAGAIEARGRTGRRPTSAEKSGSGGRSGSGRARTQVKAARYEKPPTWKASLVKSAIAAVIVFGLVTLLAKRSAVGNILLLPIIIGIYAPMIYYTDMWMHRRYLRKKAER
jgi:hypothetical protein